MCMYNRSTSCCSWNNPCWSKTGACCKGASAYVKVWVTVDTSSGLRPFRSNPFSFSLPIYTDREMWQGEGSNGAFGLGAHFCPMYKLKSTSYTFHHTHHKTCT